MIRRPPRSPLFPYTTLSRSRAALAHNHLRALAIHHLRGVGNGSAASAHRHGLWFLFPHGWAQRVSLGDDPIVPRQFATRDRKSTRLNSSHLVISYAVFCLKK